MESIPIEVRRRIFGYALTTYEQSSYPYRRAQGPKTPVLLEALRGTPLYEEALEIFYKENTFKLHLENCHKLNELSNKTLASVENLEIAFTYVLSFVVVVSNFLLHLSNVVIL